MRNPFGGETPGTRPLVALVVVLGALRDAVEPER